MSVKLTQSEAEDVKFIFVDKDFQLLPALQQALPGV